ncbi:hypothetical protein, partial [Pseudomonas syringae]|uniref:hypothetical protein n=1 Tax=Pseudomonas syringae TaxID=317 RepID=UPI001A7E127D
AVSGRQVVVDVDLEQFFDCVEHDLLIARLGRKVKDRDVLLRIPRSSGHPFHEHPATDSTMIRPPIPRLSGHP